MKTASARCNGNRSSRCPTDGGTRSPQAGRPWPCLRANGLIDGSLGFHRKYLLCIVDECCGVPAELWEAAEPLASNAAGIGFASGNRTDPASHFAEVCKSGSGWEVQQMSAYPNPAYTAEKVPDDRRARSAP